MFYNILVKLQKIVSEDNESFETAPESALMAAQTRRASIDRRQHLRGRRQRAVVASRSPTRNGGGHVPTSARRAAAGRGGERRRRGGGVEEEQPRATSSGRQRQPCRSAMGQLGVPLFCFSLAARPFPSLSLYLFLYAALLIAKVKRERF